MKHLFKISNRFSKHFCYFIYLLLASLLRDSYEMFRHTLIFVFEFLGTSYIEVITLSLKTLLLEFKLSVIFNGRKINHSFLYRHDDCLQVSCNRLHYPNYKQILESKRTMILNELRIKGTKNIKISDSVFYNHPKE